MKILDGKELAGFVKKRQATEVRTLKAQGVSPKLVIIRDSDNPVIVKYVNLKAAYGADIGAEVLDILATDLNDVKKTIEKANSDPTVSGIIVQLPLKDISKTDEVVGLISPEKDVDGLSGSVLDLKFVQINEAQCVKNNLEATQKENSKNTLKASQEKRSCEDQRIFDSATATAINWLLTGYDINLPDKKIAIVGRGRLVGAPLYRMFKNSGLNVTIFGHDADLTTLKNYDLIITATGVAHLIKSEMIKPRAIVVDAGTASEGGKLVGDVDPKVLERKDLAAITPEKGGVGPLTVAALFDNVIRGAK